MNFTDPCVFGDTISPDDIEQGQLGNCYFVSVLSSMAASPERVRSMFDTQEFNEAGIYLLKLYINGILTPVIVDDFVPCRDGRTAFANRKDGILWVSLVEKAWAKLHGTNARVEGGQSSIVMNHLSGLPTKQIVHKEVVDYDDYWEKLKFATKRQFKMIASA